jgi:hypothetical protein
MKYLIILSLLFLSFCTTSRIPKEYRKMEKRINKRQKREFRDSLFLSVDTINWKWYQVSDSTILGTPKIIR